MEWTIKVWWRATKRHANYTYASEKLAKEHYLGFKQQHSVTNVVLYNPSGRIVAIDGILSGRQQ